MARYNKRSRMWEEIIMRTSTTKSMPGDWFTEQLWCFRLSFQKPGSTLPDVEATGTALEGTFPGSQWTLPASIIVSARCDPELLTTVPLGTCKNSFWTFSWSVNIYQTHLEKWNDKRKICIQTPLTCTVVNVCVNSATPTWEEAPSCPWDSAPADCSTPLACTKKVMWPLIKEAFHIFHVQEDS